MTALYDLAITSYALAKAGSSLGAVAFSKLDKFAHLKSKYIFQYRFKLTYNAVATVKKRFHARTDC